ncbi:hypothetical protein LZQ00_09865 [Sphingobacterium sp. SRCM116780]|uniref:hypothetical protein n=1 Tax=Sphingobacterium sp. SRCM116780 TaxID=2907623 RepID=UPI001F41620F|nr:hypothetical protein [Sphingobacterium sp. SRCM116780]UIR54579.1 hypothetical protein LZQ00_09865 [Sphingobacterium sp. SRCM116780]
MKYILTIMTLFALWSCSNPEDEQKLEQLDKKSAREVTLKTITQGDSVLHITVQNIWYNGDKIATKNDTIKTAAAPKTWNKVDSTQTLSKVPIFVTVQ